jgi:hypothetical protein
MSGDDGAFFLEGATSILRGDLQTTAKLIEKRLHIIHRRDDPERGIEVCATDGRD